MANHGDQKFDVRGGDPMTTVKGTMGDRDLELFCSVVKHMTSKPEVDWDAVASEMGYKSTAVATTRFRQVKQKLGIVDKTATPRSAKGKNSVADRETTPAITKTLSKVTKARKTPANGKKNTVHAGEAPVDAAYGAAGADAVLGSADTAIFTTWELARGDQEASRLNASTGFLQVAESEICNAFVKKEKFVKREECIKSENRNDDDDFDFMQFVELDDPFFGSPFPGFGDAI